MLVLARRTNQRTIMIAEKDIPAGTRIVISVANISFPQVKLGFDAPDDIAILREEVERREWKRYGKWENYQAD